MTPPPKELTTRSNSILMKVKKHLGMSKLDHQKATRSKSTSSIIVCHYTIVAVPVALCKKAKASVRAGTKASTAQLRQSCDYLSNAESWPCIPPVLEIGCLDNSAIAFIPAGLTTAALLLQRRDALQYPVAL